VPDADKNNQIWKDVMAFFFESVEVRMIVSKMMLEVLPPASFTAPLDAGSWPPAPAAECDFLRRAIPASTRRTR
jgi:hypothetical protein